MAHEQISIQMVLTVTREDGEHVAIGNTVMNVDRTDESEVFIASAIAGASVVEMISALVTHNCDDDDRPVRLGDARN